MKKRFLSLSVAGLLLVGASIWVFSPSSARTVGQRSEGGGEAVGRGGRLAAAPLAVITSEPSVTTAADRASEMERLRRKRS
ncbi:MAG: hypothetical protein ACLQOO_36625 [Terriglobia bacterium]